MNESTEKLTKYKEKLAKSSHFYPTAQIQPVYSERKKQIDVNSNSLKRSSVGETSGTSKKLKKS